MFPLTCIMRFNPCTNTILEYKLFIADSSGPIQGFVGLDTVENVQKCDEREARLQTKTC